MKGLGVEVDETLVIDSLIKALPAKFASFLENWTMFDEDTQTLAHFTEKVLVRAKALAGARSESGNKLAVLAEVRQREASNEDLTNGAYTCNYCKKVGHWEKDCRKISGKNVNKRASLVSVRSNSKHRGQTSVQATTLPSLALIALAYKLGGAAQCG